MTNIIMSSEGVERTTTLTTTVFERLRDDILSGVLLPGEKLRIEALRQRYDVGASPVREALNRLAALGFVTQIDQRGFRVSPVSLDDMFELTRTRRLVNEIVLRESIARGDAEWEERIVLSYHRMVRLARRFAGGDESIRGELAQRHRDFHTALIAACGSHWLIDFYDMLFDYARRYQRLSMSAGAKPRDVEKEHRPIMEAVLARETDKAIALLNEHVTLTAQIVSESQFAMEDNGETNDNSTIG